MNEKIIICDCDHQDVDTEKAVFDKAGQPFRWHHCMTQQEVIDECKGAVVFLNQYVRMDKVIFEAIPTLKCIVRYGVGVDNVNVDDATAYGVQVCNVPDYGTNEVADQALALMMNLVRKVYVVNAEVREGIWDYRRTIPIKRNACSTVGIIGLGRIGKAFSRRVHALGCRVIACDPLAGTEGFEVPDYVTMTDLDTLLRSSDIISIHCSLNETSRGMIGRDELAKMKPTAYLINVARGGIIDEEALDEALTNGVIAGAGLDVVASEHLNADAPLLRHKNFLVSPHMAWYSEESAVELNRKAAEEAVRFLNGEPVHYPINHV